MDFTEQYDFYPPWNMSRYNFIIEKFGADYFLHKTILDLGAGNGDIGELFRMLGAKVTCVEGKPENIHDGMRKYPLLRFEQHDLENWEWPNIHYDIVICFGILYHLDNYQEVLKQALVHCKSICFLESEVTNTTRDIDYFIAEVDHDQNAISGKSYRPSSSRIERLVKELNFTPEVQITNKLNASFHVYDWEISDEGKLYTIGKRRFWICKRNDI